MRTLGRVAVAAVALGAGAATASGSAAIPLTPCAEPAVARPDQARQLARLVNAERYWRGLPALRLVPAISSRAQARSLGMAAAGEMSHAMSGGRLVWAPPGRLAGENLALAPDPLTALDAMIASPAHRRLLFSRRYRSMGVGAAATCDGTVFTMGMLR